MAWLLNAGGLLYLWASSSKVWLLCTSSQVNFPFSFIKAHLFSQRPWVPSSGLWSVSDGEWRWVPIKVANCCKRWGGDSPLRWVFQQKSTDWSLMIPATHRKLIGWFQVLSFLTPGFCLSQLRVPSEQSVPSFTQQVFAEHLVCVGLYRKLWKCGGE